MIGISRILNIFKTTGMNRIMIGAELQFIVFSGNAFLAINKINSIFWELTCNILHEKNPKKQYKVLSNLKKEKAWPGRATVLIIFRAGASFSDD